MPRPKKNDTQSQVKKQSSSNNSVKTTAWINLYLSVEDESELSTRELTDTVLVGECIALLDAGCDLFLRKNASDGSVSATIVRDADDDESARVGLSGYSDNWRDALASLLFKYYDKLDGVLNKPVGRNASRYR